MGTDITAFFEVRTNKESLLVNRKLIDLKKDGFEIKWKFVKEAYIGRNELVYAFFGGWAQSSEEFKPISYKRGFPIDISDNKIVDKELEMWNPSFFTFKEFEDYQSWDQKILFRDIKYKVNGLEYIKSGKILDLDVIDPATKIFYKEFKELGEKVGSENVRIIFWFS